jgi:hypothetical protein
LKGKGDLFYRKGEKEPFTGTAVSQVAGKKTEAEFWQGRMHGVYQSWFSNGQMEGEAHFDKGVREGRARLWNKDGQMIKETRFREGLADGPATEWYPNGKMERRTSWRAGKRHGEVETWFASGNRKGVGTYDQGERSGTFVVWWETGKKRQERPTVGGWSGMRMGQSIRRLFLKTVKRVRSLDRVSLEPAGGWD